MADFPTLPIWVGDFIGDTQHLGALETGAYLMLLFSAWRTPECRLPDDEKMLARMARCSPSEWRRIRTAVLAFWSPTGDGHWRQKRLDIVRRQVEEKYIKAVQAGQASALKRQQTRSTDVPRVLQPPLPPSANSGATNQNQTTESESVSENLTVAAREPAPDRSRSGSRAQRQTVDERMKALSAKFHATAATRGTA